MNKLQKEKGKLRKKPCINAKPQNMYTMQKQHLLPQIKGNDAITIFITTNKLNITF